jgi:hypothetical protein
MVAQLPIVARRKYAALEQTRDDCRSRMQALLERDKVLAHRLAMTRNRLGHVTDADERASIEEECQFITEDLDKVERDRAKVANAGQSTDQTLAQLNAWLPLLNTGQAGPIAGPIRAVTVDAKPEPSLLNAITNIRGEVARIRSELGLTKTAPPSRAEIVAHCHALAKQLAEEGKPKLTTTGGKITVHLADQPMFAAPGTAFSAPAGSMSKMLAAWDEAAFAHWVIACLGPQPDGINAQDRASRIAELERELLAAERIEEHFVGMAIDQGLDVLRRFDASPWALLQIGAEPLPQVAVAAE